MFAQRTSIFVPAKRERERERGGSPMRKGGKGIAGN